MTLSAMLIARGVARGIHVAGSLSVLGTVAVKLFVLPDMASRAATDAREHLNRMLSRLVWISFTTAFIAGFVRLVFESIYVSDSNNLAGGVASFIPVIWYSNFGHLLVIRIVLLTLCAAMFENRGNIKKDVIALGLAVLGVVLQAGLGHGAAMSGIEGAMLLAMLALHLLAAGVWLGGLLPLDIAIRAA